MENLLLEIKSILLQMKNLVELDIFKGKGGLDESNRLNVPLLSRIPS